MLWELIVTSIGGLLVIEGWLRLGSDEHDRYTSGGASFVLGLVCLAAVLGSLWGRIG